MAVNLYKILTEKQSSSVESKVEELRCKIETVFKIVLDIPMRLKSNLLEAKQKISVLENRLDVMDGEISQLNTIGLFRAHQGNLNRDEKNYNLRYCYNCKRKLIFKEFCYRNRTMDHQRLLILWKHPYIELYCCSCFKKLENEEFIKKCVEDTKRARKELVPSEKEALIFIEKRLNSKVMINKGIKISLRRSYHNDPCPREFSIKDRHVVGLKLTNSGLTSLPIEVQLFSKLEILDIANNLISTIPEWLCELKNLKYIDLTQNNISYIPKSLLNRKNLLILPQNACMKNHMVNVIKEFKQKIGKEIPVKN